MLNQKSLLILGAITVAAIGGAALSMRGNSGAEVAGAEKGPLFPELRANVNNVARLVYRQGKDVVDVALSGGEWTLASRGGYPANFEKAKETLMQVANLEIDEVKTANPAYHEQLGVQDPSAESQSREITLYDAKGATLASVILGNSPQRARDAAFVRKGGEDQSYQVKGRVSASARLSEWVVTDVLKIAADRVDELVIEHPDGERLEIARDPLDPTRKPIVVNVPEGRELTYATVATPIIGALASLQLEDVDLAQNVTLPEDAITHARFHCNDGLVVDLQLAQVDEVWWSKLSASHDESLVSKPIAPVPPAAASDEAPEESEDEVADGADDEGTESAADVAAAQFAEAQAAYERSLAAYEAKLEATRKEAELLNETHAKWAYALPSYRATNLTKRMDDLLKPLPDPDAEAVDGAPPSEMSQDELQKLLQEAGIDPSQLGNPAQGGGASSDG